jgi:hypothetical protein
MVSRVILALVVAVSISPLKVRVTAFRPSSSVKTIFTGLLLSAVS